MQSMPAYYTPSYPSPSPYPTTNGTTTTTTTNETSSPGNGSTVMTISNPPTILATSNGLSPLEQSLLRNTTTSPENATAKRNQVKNACSKYPCSFFIIYFLK